MSRSNEAARRAVASVGVIGGGIFGVTAAAELARSGFAVTLYEKRDDIVSCTTARNFFRIHRGYHYPRDPPTAREARDGYTSFAQLFSAVFTAPVPSYYVIAARESQTTVERFEQHCRALGLRARRVPMPHLVPGSAAMAYEVDEAYYDAALLRGLAWQHLRSQRVQVELRSRRIPRDVARAHDSWAPARRGGVRSARGPGQHRLRGAGPAHLGGRRAAATASWCPRPSAAP